MRKYDIKTAKHMLDTKRYPYVLFMCHLAIEKLLKGIYTRENREHSTLLYTQLGGLSKKIKTKSSEDQQKLLSELSSFNIEAKCPEWKSDFYRKATKSFTEKYYEQTKNFYTWLKKYLKK